MKVCVYGVWHLGAVTAACLADSGFDTVGLEDSAEMVAGFNRGEPPLFEPGLEDLFRAGLASGKLRFSADAKTSVSDADVVWIAFDTPVDSEDRADFGFVTGRIAALFPHLRDGAVVLVSSQLPAGTMQGLEAQFADVAGERKVAFAYSPENLRLGKAVSVFRHPERVVVGVRGEAGRETIAALFAPFSSNIIWTGVEAAELSKHAINAFLAMSVTFINEIAAISEQIGADVREVEQALRSEPRIGEKAYIRPGAAFAGGTLARDVNFLGQLAAQNELPLHMIGNILTSNRAHAGWPLRRLKEALGDMSGKRIAVLGLSYKAGTDAIRRSLAVELVEALSEAGAQVSAFDPKVTGLPEAPAGFACAADMKSAIEQAEALVVMTEWPEFKELSADEVVTGMTRPLVVDQNGFLGHLRGESRITYLSVGTPL